MLKNIELNDFTVYASVDYFYKKYLQESADRETLIRKDVYKEIMILFHKKIIHAMCEKLYVFNLPFGIGNIYIGEEAVLRKMVREVYVDENGKKTCRLAPNVGLKKCFRVYWNKNTCKLGNKFAYYLKPIPKASTQVGMYILDRDSDPLKPNFRAYLIANET